MGSLGSRGGGRDRPLHGPGPGRCASDLRGQLGRPLDATFAKAHGGRWNPPGSWRTLYLNEDLVTARLNLNLFIAGWPYEPEDLHDTSGPHLAVATLPRNQAVADVHTPTGVAAVSLPPTYPSDAAGQPVPPSSCQAIGEPSRAHLVARLTFTALHGWQKLTVMGASNFGNNMLGGLGIPAPALVGNVITYAELLGGCCWVGCRPTTPSASRSTRSPAPYARGRLSGTPDRRRDDATW
ncbi:hypothetical protein BH23ACT9_BH23ACT9_07960 [soil metagenome]